MRRQIALLIAAAGIYACTNEEITEPADLIDESKENLEITQDLGEMVPLVVDPATLPKMPTTRAITSDRIYANRDANLHSLDALTFKFRSISTGQYLNVSNNELELNSSTGANFDIKNTYPASTGVSYVIFYSGRPLTVGYYTNNPDDEFVMVSNNTEPSYMSYMDILNGINPQGSVVFKHDMFLDTGPDGWPYNNVWQVTNNKLRFGRYTQSSTQEFYIIVPQTWTLGDITYATYGRKTDAGNYTLTGTYTNSGSAPIPYNMTMSGSAYETSYFTEAKTGLRFTMASANSNLRFRRPYINSTGAITVDTSVPMDAPYTSSTTSISTLITKVLPLNVPAYTKIDVTYRMKRYEVEVDYEAAIKFNKGRNIFSATLIGTWKGIRHVDENIEPDLKLTNLLTGEVVIMSLPVAKAMKIINESF